MSGVNSAKPYGIAKRTVWEAYQQVKANRGAAGVDDETIADFERDLSKNLYKLWNRMSSGSYFPSPAKQVEIPKASGGTRKLGVPKVSDRVAQTVVKLLVEPELDPVFHPDSYGYHLGRHSGTPPSVSAIVRNAVRDQLGMGVRDQRSAQDDLLRNTNYVIVFEGVFRSPVRRRRASCPSCEHAATAAAAPVRGSAPRSSPGLGRCIPRPW